MPTGRVPRSAAASTGHFRTSSRAALSDRPQIPLIDKPLDVLTQLQGGLFVATGAPDRARDGRRLPRLPCHLAGREETAKRAAALGAAEAPRGQRNQQIPVRSARMGPVPRAIGIARTRTAV